MSPTFKISGIAIRELLYEKAFYLLVAFTLASLGLSLLLGQMTYVERGKLTLDFMIGSSQLSMVLFSIFMGVSLFQRELTLGSIAMILSKPIPRRSFLVGKFIGQTVVQWFLLFAMSLVTYGICLWVQHTPSVVSLAQTFLLIALEIAILNSIVYVFAVNSGALITSLGSILIFYLGHFRSGASQKMGAAHSNPAWQIARTFIPDLEIFNMKALASYGLTIDYSQLGWSALYAAICIVFYLSVAILCFSRKDILT